MMYQLPNGKVIYMSLEEYFNMSDDELNQTANMSIGEDPSSKMYYGKSSLKKNKPVSKDIDYIPDQEDPTKETFDINNLPDNME